jgi:hypothetical protein
MAVWDRGGMGCAVPVDVGGGVGVRDIAVAVDDVCPADVDPQAARRPRAISRV